MTNEYTGIRKDEVFEFPGPVKCTHCKQELTASEFTDGTCGIWPVLISMPIRRMLEQGQLVHPNCGGRLGLVLLTW